MNSSRIGHYQLTLFFVVILLSATLLHAQGKWTTGSVDGFSPRTYASSAVVDGKMYVIGGLPSVTTPGAVNTVEAYDPQNDTWSTPETTGAFLARGAATASVVAGKIFVIAGLDDAWTPMNTIQIYDVATKEWTSPTIATSCTARQRHVAAVVGNRIYIIGGVSGTNLNLPLEFFDVATFTWSTPTVSGTFTPRRQASAAVVDGKIYVFGGYNGSTALNTLEVFDPVTNTWSVPPADVTNAKRYGGGATVVQNKIYLTGGFSGTQMVEDLEVFDPRANEWNIENTTGTFTGRSGVVASAIDGRIFVIGGATLTGMATDNEIYSPVLAADVESQSDELSPRLYPNPTTSQVTVRCAADDITHISVLNTLGAVVLEQRATLATQSTLDLSNLSSGLYYVHVRGLRGDLVRTVVKD